ncbi:DUF1177 domain-containing protein [Candidatus Roizmanbacteria bacterium CG02_land_8_20_14_3_00_36_15]|uniref:DUF1177 domain-containing protein n=2 Tax=Candidatus Roizmaniibacteriota TaxID=1752723 RepID=A0A2M8KLV6_9BACT|nr:MAG: DUF1177 domain-containing protein [Candidatus Roizmanbacteria bacterium CG02_land_8_20_14_3_00_36_15]PIY70181.1 MAG: DUF1177 domain-containing protein [Candidatus Roizmanbacteria bacterium CG_4_10_14_0_8_um_filter_36_36]PJC81337.1 MAG: DUF1177 domain-containing protein [Candidatus Roizmanbacteria bacterium CG_4_8_14_3_um_filter_36_10]PJE60902.1 MAG: DUF1177 domain-containing protein [Candidatus Roizmanbacteria bacterium CG10_big_fil_rev_8_21_14_0_10_36_26]
MIVSEILTIYDLLDRPGKPGGLIFKLFKKYAKTKISLKRVREKTGETEFLKIIIPGKKGKQKGGRAPTLGIIGRLGGVGARPEIVGFVSDGDGALAVLSTALRLVKMAKQGDQLMGDIILTTHVCTNAPTTSHNPVPFMGSPVDLATMNKYEVDEKMEAILSVDTSRGNKIINHNGFAISPTIKEGYILRISDDLLSIMEQTTGKLSVTFPITTQDITPYGNGIYHFNSILQPATATKTPVVGVAITSEVPVAGCATGITNINQIDSVGRFLIEVAQRFGKSQCQFYDKTEFQIIIKKYGCLRKLQELR